MRMVRKSGWGFLEGKGKEKWKEKWKEWTENEMKSDGDGYDKINWWKKKWGLGWSEQNK